MNASQENCELFIFCYHTLSPPLKCSSYVMRQQHSFDFVTQTSLCVFFAESRSPWDVG